MLITVTQAAPPAPAATPVAASREAAPRRESANVSADASTRESRARSTPASSSAPQGTAQYRLVHDKELNRTFVQVVDRESGEEILRFPPEQLIRFIDSNIERNRSGSAAGLLVDRSV